jgi:hypothetical protein
VRAELPPVDRRHDAVVPVERDLVDFDERLEAGAELLRVLLHPVRELGPHDVIEARVVLNLGGVHELPARDGPLEHERRYPRTARVKRRRLPRRPGSDDDDLVALSVCVSHRIPFRFYFTF